MSNKTLVPAIRYTAGHEVYYVCTLTFAEAVRRFVPETGPRADFQDDGHPKREAGLPTPVVATCDGTPFFTPLHAVDDGPAAQLLDGSVGVLTFDGLDQLSAICGNGSVKLINRAIRTDWRARRNEICVIIVKRHGSLQAQSRDCQTASFA
jgi:hypothetical protein